MSYRPICDTWILARSKVKYYGAYPAGFLARARALLGVTIEDTVLHVCSGRVVDYPFDGFGENDVTMDADPSLEPFYCQDVREPWEIRTNPEVTAVLMDPPYTEDDAAHYTVGREMFPQPGELLREAAKHLAEGQRVGLLHYVWPKPPDTLKNIAVITVLVGFNNRARLYTVYERV
jgi:hypothetical protein